MPDMILTGVEAELALTNMLASAWREGASPVPASFQSAARSLLATGRVQILAPPEPKCVPETASVLGDTTFTTWARAAAVALALHYAQRCPCGSGT